MVFILYGIYILECHSSIKASKTITINTIC